MLDCRYYDLCCFTDDSCNGEQECPKRERCQFYSPMPGVKALLELADECGDASRAYAGDGHELTSKQFANVARRIREALGVE